MLSLVYFIIPIVLYIIGISLLATGARAAFYGNAGFGGLLALGSILSILGGIVGLIIAVFAPMGFSIYADTGDFGQALKIGEIFSLVVKNAGNYFITIAISIGLGIATWIVMLILSFLLIIPVLGYLVYLIISFYIMVYVYSVVFALFGSVYRGALATVPPAAPPV